MRKNASPLERAARALCEINGLPPGATKNGEALWRSYLPEARAVIAAIRDPGKLVLPEGADAGKGELLWYSMIDAILAEE